MPDLLTAVYTSHLVCSSVVKATQSLVVDDEGSEVNDVQYPMAEDQVVLQAAFGSNRSFPMLTIPGSVLMQLARSSECGQHLLITSTLLRRFAYLC